MTVVTRTEHAFWIPAFAGMTATVIADARSAIRNPVPGGMQ
jgi:hypothetical protein